MAIIVEPVLTLEKVRECLEEHHEQPSLDYKRAMDLKNTKDVLELAKDVGAFQSEPRGGFIAIGADDHGRLVDDMAPVDTGQFDESRLRSRLEGYFSGPIDVRSAVHDVDGVTMVLIYVAPARDGWNIFAKNGEYKDSVTNKSAFVFREGDVFVRRGTSSVRWRSEDQQRVIQQLIASRREDWRRELRHELATAADVSASAEALRRGISSGPLSWRLDAEGFDELALQLIRGSDEIPLRRMLFEVQRDASSLYGEGSDELGDLLDRVTEFAALAVAYRKRDWLNSAIKVLVRIYENGFDERGYEILTKRSVDLWLEIVTRVHALGALAVRLEDWRSVALLAGQRPRGDQFGWYGSWLRHGLTMGARANLVEDDNNVIARAANAVRRLSAVRPDIALESEDLLSSLCQFDVYGCLHVMGARRSIDSGNFYPTFARYSSWRSEPAFIKLIEDGEAKTAIFPEDSEWLAVCMRELVERAGIEGMRYMSWMGVNSDVINNFLRENPATNA